MRNSRELKCKLLEVGTTANRSSAQSEETGHILRQVEFHHTPKHAGWLNMVEIEIGALQRQRLHRRIPDRAMPETEVAARERRRNGCRAMAKCLFTKEWPGTGWPGPVQDPMPPNRQGHPRPITAACAMQLRVPSGQVTPTASSARSWTLPLRTTAPISSDPPGHSGIRGAAVLERTISLGGMITASPLPGSPSRIEISLLHARRPHSRRGRPDARKTGIEHRGVGHVVIADDRNVLRDTDPCPHQPMHEARGRLVIVDKHRCGQIAGPDQPLLPPAARNRSTARR